MIFFNSLENRMWYLSCIRHNYWLSQIWELRIIIFVRTFWWQVDKRLSWIESLYIMYLWLFNLDHSTAGPKVSICFKKKTWIYLFHQLPVKVHDTPGGAVAARYMPFCYSLKITKLDQLQSHAHDCFFSGDHKLSDSSVRTKSRFAHLFKLFVFSLLLDGKPRYLAMIFNTKL